MDALAFLQDRTKTLTGRVIFCFLCLMPVAGVLIDRLLHHTPAFMDIDAVMCAAQAEALHQSPYGALHCAGLAPAAYVYAPQVAGWFIPLVHTLGSTGARWACVLGLFLPAVTALSWYALGRALPGVDWRYRLLAMSCLQPIAFCSGNFGIVLHALVIFCAVVWPKRRWAFVLLVLACAVIKPTFLLYLLVPLFETRPWRQRLTQLALSAAAGIAVLSVTVLTAGPLAGEWRQALDAVVLRDQPGMGWFALTAWLHMAPDAPATVGITLLFMAAMTVSGLAIAKAAGLDDGERRILALGLVPLLTPRLMDYDLFAVVPCLALIMRLTPMLGGRIYRYNLSWLFAGVPLAGSVITILHLRHWPRTDVDVALFCVVVLAGGGRIALTEWEKGRGPREREKREKAARGGPLRVRRVTGGEDARGDIAGKVR